MFVDLSKPDFVGKKALETADRRTLLLGLVSETGVPSAGLEVFANDALVGKITAGDWSPTLEKGIGYVRFSQHADGNDGWLGETVMLKDKNGRFHPSQVVSLPFYDAQKRIPRGLVKAGTD